MNALEHIRGGKVRNLIVTVVVIGAGLALLSLYFRPTGGRRLQCQNNLRECVSAVQQFNFSKQHYPGSLNDVGGKRASWVVPVLPFLSRKDLYETWVPDAQPQVAVVSVLTCPADSKRAGSTNPLSYVANCGNAIVTNRADGIFFDRTTAINVIDMTARYVAMWDGISCTVLLSENLQAENWGTSPTGTAPYFDFPTNDDARRYTGFVWYDIARPQVAQQQINGLAADTTASKPTSDLTWARPSSDHAGGVNVAFCDGRVSFLSEKISYQVYKQLMTPDNRASSNSDKTPLDETALH